ncbi:MAG: hypothetical protein A3J79_09095 [Elusimicrobia bacterium RIFOXYB2_FULL_62_6]|nr:MAG: hypothetical protein A3J79_09095 [Elusimicrobia bacterium RIFOXYB2_FULL_62_6]
MKIIYAVLLLATCSGSVNAQMMQVIPAPSTAPVEGLSFSTSTLSPSKPDLSGRPSKPAEYGESKNPLSGLILMPTAYRGRGKNSIGLGLDFNAAYYIGRLYGKNTYSWTNQKTNYIDRVGLWLLMADGKMLIQTEGKLRPAMAAGVIGGYQLRDSPQPGLNTPFSLAVKVDQKTNKTFASAYLALTKRIHPKFVVNAGYSDGTMPKLIYQMSEFLSKDALLNFGGYSDYNIPTGMIFGGLMWLPRSDRSIGLEIMAPQGAPMAPKLINLHLGTLLKLNFEISYLTFKGGWDVLGMFQFRYGYFPR